LRSTRARLTASSTIGSESFEATMRTDSPGARMPRPLPWRPDWFLTSARAACIRSSTEFGFLKYDGHLGSGYFSPPAPTRAAAVAAPDPVAAPDSAAGLAAFWQAPDTTATLQSTDSHAIFFI